MKTHPLILDTPGITRISSAHNAITSIKLGAECTLMRKTSKKNFFILRIRPSSCENNTIFYPNPGPNPKHLNGVAALQLRYY